MFCWRTSPTRALTWVKKGGIIRRHKWRAKSWLRTPLNLNSSSWIQYSPTNITKEDFPVFINFNKISFCDFSFFIASRCRSCRIVCGTSLIVVKCKRGENSPQKMSHFSPIRIRYVVVRRVKMFIFLLYSLVILFLVFRKLFCVPRESSSSSSASPLARRRFALGHWVSCFGLNQAHFFLLARFGCWFFVLLLRERDSEVRVRAAKKKFSYIFSALYLLIQSSFVTSSRMNRESNEFSLLPSWRTHNRDAGSEEKLLLKSICLSR